ncbi:TIR domain-containing protein [Planctomycetota bacterium]
MQVFISWSGELSRKLGEAFRDWLPLVQQNINPYFSPVDVKTGAFWRTQVVTNLRASQFGILCLTPDNLAAPWLLFEAGAIAGHLEEPHVCPICFGFEPRVLQSPLADLQAIPFEKEKMAKLVGDINELDEETRLTREQVRRAFDKWWEELKTKIEAVHVEHGEMEAPPEPTMEQKVDEILERARLQARVSSAPPLHLSEFVTASGRLRAIEDAFQLELSRAQPDHPIDPHMVRLALVQCLLRNHAWDLDWQMPTSQETHALLDACVSAGRLTKDRNLAADGTMKPPYYLLRRQSGD